MSESINKKGPRVIDIRDKVYKKIENDTNMRKIAAIEAAYKKFKKRIKEIEREAINLHMEKMERLIESGDNQDIEKAYEHIRRVNDKVGKDILDDHKKEVLLGKLIPLIPRIKGNIFYCIRLYKYFISRINRETINSYYDRFSNILVYDKKSNK